MIILIRYFMVLMLSLQISGNHSIYNDNLTGGKELYAKHCLPCHQAEGSGVPGMFPPLVNTEKVIGQPDSLIRIVLFGLKGPTEVAGQIYTQEMPAAGHLTDPEVAEILTWIRSSWGNKATAVTSKRVAEIRLKGN